MSDEKCLTPYFSYKQNNRTYLFCQNKLLIDNVLIHNSCILKKKYIRIREKIFDCSGAHPGGEPELRRYPGVADAGGGASRHDGDGQPRHRYRGLRRVHRPPPSRRQPRLLQVEPRYNTIRTVNEISEVSQFLEKARVRVFSFFIAHNSAFTLWNLMNTLCAMALC